MRHGTIRTLRSAPALLLALAACSSGPKEVSPETKLELYRETALAHYENDDLGRAESQALKGLAIDEEDAQLRLLYGWIQLRKGGTADLLRVERLFAGLETSKDYRVLLGLAAAKERLGMVYRESADGVESGAVFTDHPDPARRAVELRASAERSWSEARELFLGVLALRPGSIQALNGLQRVDALRNDYESSLAWSAELLAAAEVELGGWDDQLRLGDLNVSQESRLREAQRSTRELWIETRLYAAEACHRLERDAEALEHLDQAIVLDPARAEAHSRRAQLLIALDRPVEAREALHEYLRHAMLEYDHPDVRQAYDLLAGCERRIAELGPAN